MFHSLGSKQAVTDIGLGKGDMVLGRFEQIS